MLRVVVLDQHGKAAGVDLGVLAEGFLGNQMRAAVQDDLRRLDNADAAVVENIPLGTDDLEPPAVKGVAAAAQGGQRLDRAAQPLLGGVPVKERTVERVAVALHGDLVAVVDAGHAGQREDQRSWPLQGSPAIAVMARSVSWVDRKFIAQFSAGAG